MLLVLVNIIFQLFIIYYYIMDKLELPQSFWFEGNVSQGGKLWLKRFEFYLIAAEKSEENG